MTDHRAIVLATLHEWAAKPEIMQILHEFASEPVPSKPKPKARAPKHRTYTRQILPGVPPVTFSDKPLKVNGVTIKPTWAWSDDYRAHARKTLANVRSHPGTMESAYVAWYAKERGLSRCDAQKRISETQGVSLAW